MVRRWFLAARRSARHPKWPICPYPSHYTLHIFHPQIYRSTHILFTLKYIFWNLVLILKSHFGPPHMYTFYLLMWHCGVSVIAVQDPSLNRLESNILKSWPLNTQLMIIPTIMLQLQPLIVMLLLLPDNLTFLTVKKN